MDSRSVLAFDIIPHACRPPYEESQSQPPSSIWKRPPDWEEVTFECRPATAPNEKLDHYWTCRRGYQLSRADANRGISDQDIFNIKRQMIQDLSAESNDVMTERDWHYELRFRVDMACGMPVMWCWLE